MGTDGYVQTPAGWHKSPALYCGRGGREQPAGSHAISWRDSNYLARQLATYAPAWSTLLCFQTDRGEFWAQSSELLCS